MTKKEHTRIQELDWLKAVCILLMVTFHLVFIEHKYPEAKGIIYVFHMPVFLLISGYLMNTQKDTSSFLKSLCRLIIPYLIMESLYVIAASILPINEHIDNLNVAVFLDKVLLHPIGPYWFLHALALLSIINYIVAHTALGHRAIGHVAGVILLAYAISQIGILSFMLALYYLLGVLIRKVKIDFFEFFNSRLLDPILAILFIIFLYPFGKEDFAGLIFNYLVISSLLLVFRYMPEVVRRVSGLIGRETLAILLFSPIFTLAAKYYQPFICRIDSTGMLFLLISLFIAVGGSIVIKRVAQKLHIDKYIFLE